MYYYNFISIAYVWKTNWAINKSNTSQSIITQTSDASKHGMSGQLKQDIYKITGTGSGL